jgi:O-acetyl-ADP-ribose deacetylase (regulator of RNase III)
MAGIHYRKDDIFLSEAKVLVNTVNCKGVMGKGIALAFKQRYPEMFPVYQQECKTGKLHIGRPTLYCKSMPWILNFPTKDNWKANSKIEYLEAGLIYFAENYKEAGITSIAFPKLGTQNGKLPWEEVGPLMVKYLANLDIDVYIYISEGDREYQTEHEQDKYAWQHFNEIALSSINLQQELSINKKDALKIEQQRSLTEFTSQADVIAIEGLAKITVKRIKDYIQTQIYLMPELPGISSDDDLIKKPKIKKKYQSTNKKSRKSVIQAQASPALFPIQS